MTFKPFFCNKCNFTSFDGLDHDCNPKKKKSSFYSRRYSKCCKCIFNNNGKCNKDSSKPLKDKQKDFYEKCPDNFWLPVISLCHNCHNVVVDTDNGVQNCIYCGEEINKLNQDFLEKQDNDEKFPVEKFKNFDDDTLEFRKVNVNSSSVFTGTNGMKSRWLSTDDLMRDTLHLIPKIPKDIDAIVGVSRSGLPSASMLSMMLHLPMFIFRQNKKDVIYAGGGWRLNGFKSDAEAKRDFENPRHVLVVDDTVFTGSSNRIARSALEGKFDKITYGSIYVNPKARNFPDIWSVDLGWPHMLEWNIFNSVLTPNMVVDFDGILCHDCPIEADDDGEKYLNFIRNAKPKYITRKNHIPMIVTARIEKYRKETVEWLRKNKIKFKNLVMHPAKTLKERRSDDIAAYKAKHYNIFCESRKPSPPPFVFLESEERQAKRISQFTKHLVVCPSSKQCHQSK